MIFWIILGAALLIITALWFSGRPPRATVEWYDFLGETRWRWRAGQTGEEDYDTRSAAILAAEQQGYMVEGE